MYRFPALLTPVPLAPFTTEEISGCTKEAVKGVDKTGRNPHFSFLYFMFYCFSNTSN